MIVASINVAGLRGAALTGKAAKIGSGFREWFASNSQKLYILALQEMKVMPAEMLPALEALDITTDDIYLQPDVHKKGHAGVALWFNPRKVQVNSVRTPFENLDITQEYCYSGRWIEADVVVDGTAITIVCAYFHHADSPTLKGRDGVLINREKSEQSMFNKHKFMAVTTSRMRQLIQEKPHLLVVGDVNIAHHEMDLKNWKGNVTKAGFLPEERAWLDLWFASDQVAVSPNVFERYKFNTNIDYYPPPTDEFSHNGLGLTDICRKLWGDDTYYTWWTNMGHAFDNDAGWRIDYQIATSELAQVATKAYVDKQKSYAMRYSDHAPVIVEYNFSS